MKAKDLEKHPPGVILYGAAGTGKTALVSQAKDAYMFDFDNGMRTALTLKDKFSELRQNIEFDIYVDTNFERPSAYLSAKTKLMDLHGRSQTGKCPYKACIIDSLTGLSRAVSMHVMASSGKGSMATPQIQHYGMMVSEIESVFTILRSMNLLVMVTAHEALIETDNEVLLRIMSVTQKHGMNKLPWLFDEVLRTKVRPMGQNKINYIVSGIPSSSVTVRTRSGITDDMVINEIGLAGLLDRMGYKQDGD